MTQTAPAGPGPVALAEIAGRELPADADLWLVSSAILDPSVPDLVADILDSRHFLDLRARILWEILTDRADEIRDEDGKQTLPLLVTALRRTRQLDAVGGPENLSEIADLEATSAGARQLAFDIRLNWIDREISLQASAIGLRPDDADAEAAYDKLRAERDELEGRRVALTTGAAVPGRYDAIRFDEVRPQLENEDLIKGVIGRESLIVMYGASGSTKSFSATEMGLAIASGHPWRGHPTERGRVVYVAAEGARGMTNRLAAARARLSLGPADQVDFLLVRNVVRLTKDSKDVDEFVRAISRQAGTEAALVVIDTLSQSMPGKDENGPGDMTAAIEAAQRIRNGLQTAVMLVHHSGKDEARGARGHTSLKAATDTELVVRQEASGLCRIRATKQKEREAGDEWLHRLETVELGLDADREPVTSAIVRPISGPEAARDVASQRSATGRASSLAADVVEACAALHDDGKATEVPREVLADAGYLDRVAGMGWDPAVTVKGFGRSDLSDALRDRCRRDGRCDGERDGSVEDETRERNRVRQAVKRRIDTAISDGVLFLHENWAWLAERARDGSRDDREDTPKHKLT